MKPMHNGRWTVWRAISAGIALCLLVLAVICFSEARRFRKQFQDWETAKPIDTVVDLSTPGEMVAPFHQTCSSSHSEVVALRIPAAAMQSANITQLLQGASARIEIRHKQTTNVVESAELDLSWSRDPIDVSGEMILDETWRFESGYSSGWIFLGNSL